MVVPIASFRLEPYVIDQLDLIVEYHKQRQSPAEWGPRINRTTIFKTIVADTVARIIREQAELDEKAKKAKIKPTRKVAKAKVKK